jgi:hypothetical protein
MEQTSIWNGVCFGCYEELICEVSEPAGAYKVELKARCPNCGSPKIDWSAIGHVLNRVFTRRAPHANTETSRIADGVEAQLGRVH